MTIFALSAHIDFERCASELHRTGHTRLEPFLAPDAACDLRDALNADGRWRHVFNGGDKIYEVPRVDLTTMTIAERQRLHDAIDQAARHTFQYRYDSIRVDEDVAKLSVSTTLLDQFATFLNWPETLQLLGKIANTADVNFADAQATCYRHGDFLTAHDDAVAGKGRRAAYVFGLTEAWRDEWGGLLTFHDGQGRGRFFAPRFNCLDIFSVPQTHSVSVVAASAGAERLSVTGWLRRL